jgi:hypothetical protein
MQLYKRYQLTLAVQTELKYSSTVQQYSTLYAKNADNGYLIKQHNFEQQKNLVDSMTQATPDTCTYFVL